MEPTEKNTEKTTLPAKRPERVGVDINIARNQIFASRNARGYRKLPARNEIVDGRKVVRTVSVGTFRDTGKTLDTFDELVFMAVYGVWEKNGCQMDDRRVFGALTKTLTKKDVPALMAPQAGHHRKYGARDFKRLRESLDKLANVGITFDEAYENNRGWETKQITLLEKVRLFDREKSLESGGEYWEATELFLNVDVCQNIKDKKIKLFYIEEIGAIKSEAGRLIYNRLELLCGALKEKNPTEPFRRDALEFAKEIGLDVTGAGQALKRKRKIIEKMRLACAELVGKKLTSGVIVDCRIDTTPGKGNPTRWFFICEVGSVQTVRPKKNGVGVVHVVPDHRDLEVKAERQQNQRLMEKFEALPEATRKRIRDRAEKINRERHHGMLKHASLLEAITEFFSLLNLSDEVTDLAAPNLLPLREKKGQNEYAPIQCVHMVYFNIDCDQSATPFIFSPS